MSILISFAIGAAVFAAIVFALIVFGTRRAPPPLGAVNDAFNGARFEHLPALSFATSRSADRIAFRHYRADQARYVAVLIHGSTTDSHAVHLLAQFLQRGNVECYAPDVRGHGATGRRGDIDYEGQLEDDLEDLTAHIRKAHPALPLALLGHSAGGGFALRFAGGSRAALFSRYVLAAPLIHHNCPMTRPNAGGWAVAFLPRIIGLAILESLGLRWFQSLPVLAFAVPAGNPRDALGVGCTATYSYRLQKNFRPHLNWRADVRKVSRPTFVIVGEDDELFIASAYKGCLEPLNANIHVEVLPGLNHMAVYTSTRAMQALAQPLQDLGYGPATSGVAA